MKTKIIKYIGLITLISSYAILTFNFVKNGFDLKFTELFNLSWIFGILSVISNSIYAILINLDQTLFKIFGTIGLIWFVPFFIEIDPLYGVPSLLIYLIIAIKIHRKWTVYNNGYNLLWRNFPPEIPTFIPSLGYGGMVLADNSTTKP